MEDNVFGKNVDGIKRLDPKKLEKSRELVLSSIGENNNLRPKKTVESLPRGNKRINTLAPSFDSLSKKPRNKIIPKKKSVNLFSAKNENVKKTDLNKSVSQSKKPIVKKKEPKKTLTPKKIKKNKKVSPKKFKKIKHKKRKKIKIDIKLIFSITTKIIKRSLFMSAFILLVFILLYLLFVSAVLSFGKHSSLFARASSIVSVPAVVSNDGIINFADYKNIYDNFQINADDNTLFNEEIASVFILNNLLEKHKITDTAELKKTLAYDEKVNFAPLNRIRKIKSTIESEGDFIKIASKFGDVYRANINKNNINDYPFGASVAKIEEGKTSDIITTQVGYYIVHCFKKQRDELSVSYVYIPSVSLEDYLRDSSKNYKFWNLTNF